MDVTAEQMNLKQALDIKDILYMQSCNCIGPQNGEPLCPCRMRNVRVKDGRYIEEIDHGPVTNR